MAPSLLCFLWFKVQFCSNFLNEINDFPRAFKARIFQVARISWRWIVFGTIHQDVDQEGNYKILKTLWWWQIAVEVSWEHQLVPINSPMSQLNSETKNSSPSFPLMIKLCNFRPEVCKWQVSKNKKNFKSEKMSEIQRRIVNVL